MHILVVQFLVKRKGLDYAEYGLVDGGTVKRQRLLQPGASGDGTPSACGVSLAMVEEYETWRKEFERTVHDNSEDGALNLGQYFS